MRQIGKVASESEGKLFIDHLLTLGIAGKATPGREGVGIWIIDENNLPLANQEWERFRSNPDSLDFQKAREKAKVIRKDAEKIQKSFEKRVISMGERWSRPYWQRSPVSFAIMAIAVGVGLATSVGRDRGMVFQTLSFTLIHFDVEEVEISGRAVPKVEVTSEGLTPIRQGQIWRLVTPIFLHFGGLHLLFNLLMFRQLGDAVEWRKGSKKLLLMILIIAVTSNLGQFLEMQYRGSMGTFGGLSGVVYGLFGYAWIRGQLHPEQGLGVNQQTVGIMLLWFVICFTGAIGPVANTAHGVGLVAGILLALSPL